MKHQAYNHCLTFLAAICAALFSIMIAGSAAVAQLKSATGDNPGARQSSQAPSTRPTPSDQEQMVINTDLVTMTVSVIDANGRYVLGLDKKDFSVSDNKVAQEITFFSDDDLPASVSIVFDVSGSMSGDNIMTAKAALAGFVRTSHPKDEYFLIDFSSRPRLLLNRILDGDTVLRKLTYVEPHGQTALYDAAYFALAHLSNATRRKRAVLIISDGQDNDSRYTFSELRQALKESDVTVYAIGTNPNSTTKGELYGKLALEELASASGGKAFFPRNSEQMNEAFERVALELRHQYSIGYRPANFTADSKWHHVKVKVTPPIELKRVFVRSPEGYYAVGSLR